MSFLFMHENLINIYVHGQLELQRPKRSIVYNVYCKIYNV